MRCKVCENEIRTGTKYCKFCGTPVYENQKENEITNHDNKMVVCRSCGERVKAENAFCTNCGSALEGDSFRGNTKEEIPDRDDRKGSRHHKGVKRIITISVIVLVLLAGVVAFLYLRDKDAFTFFGQKQENTEEKERERLDSEERKTSEKDALEKSTSNTKEVNPDVESEVLKIRTLYNTVEKQISEEGYNWVSTLDGIDAYYDGSKLMALKIMNQDGTDANKSFYFDEDNLVFAYYESTDASRLYFKDNRLIRWRYSPDALNPEENVENYDYDLSDEYKNWEKKALSEAEYYKQSVNNNYGKMESENVESDAVVEDFRKSDSIKSINVRSEPKHASDLVGTLTAEVMHWNGNIEKGKGSDNKTHDWYQIFTDEGIVGWVRADLVVLSDVNGTHDSIKASSVNMNAIQTISASSSLSEYKMTHEPERLVDGDLSTAWVEGVDGQGEGETVTFDFDDQFLVSGFRINAGYQKTTERYEKNSRPSSITLIFSDGSEEEFALDDKYGQQVFTLGDPIVTDSITLAINDVYPGTKFEDTVISEIEFF